MPYVTYYDPVIKLNTGAKDANGNLPHHRVNGARNVDRDRAIQLASKHTSIRDKKGVIV